MKPYIKLLISYLFIAILSACTGNSSNANKSKKNTQKKGEIVEAKGGKYYGGVFRINEPEFLRSLYPLNITEVAGNRIARSMYEGLVKLDAKTLSPIPSIAKSWTVSDDAKTYRFTLNKGVYFHDNACFKNGKGRLVTAKDFKYTFDLLCTSDVNNQGFNFFKDRIKGAKAFDAALKKGEQPVSGVPGARLINEYTFEIELEQPFGSFLQLLAMPFCHVFPQEAVEKYGTNMRLNAVGTGPFVLKAIKEDEAVIMVRNTNYWAKDEHGNQLPYLDGIRYSFMKQDKATLLSFEEGKLEMKYRLPLELADEVVDRQGNLLGKYKGFVYQNMVTMAVYYYGFQHKKGLFTNKKLRQAFNYAIDREAIVAYTLKGQGLPAHNGIVPPAFPAYASTVKGYKFDAAKARALLAQAGYPNGKGFPKLTHNINSGGGRNEQVAEATQKMLKENLNIDVEIIKMPFAQHLENLETGKANFWRSGWVADYPDPENFLNLLYSVHIPPKMSDKSYINSMRYASPQFDAAFSKGLATLEDTKRNEYYRQADQIAMNDAAIIPLFYYKDIRLVQPYVRNFPQNAMEYRDMTEVYLVPH